MAPAAKPRPSRAKPKPTPAPRRGRGQPHVITDALIGELCSLIELGTPIGIAAEAAGISYRTYRRHIVAAEELLADREALEAEGRPLPALSDLESARLALLSATQKARAKMVPNYLAQIAKAAAGGAVEIEVVNEYEQVTKPDGSVEVKLVGTRRKERTLRGNWQAAAWCLERLLPEYFARTERHEVTGRDGGPVETETMINVGAKGVEDTRVSQAIDALLDSAAAA